MEIIVDGYNLIAADQGLGGDLERKRSWLIQQLVTYQRQKGFEIVVVFDAWNAPTGDRAWETRHGIKVLYSQYGEKADDVVVRLARARGASCVVVSSDREVRGAVERFGSVAIHASEFAEIVYSLPRPGGRDALELADERAIHKGGNPHRLSKTERKRREILKKLRV